MLCYLTYWIIEKIDAEERMLLDVVNDYMNEVLDINITAG